MSGDTFPKYYIDDFGRNYLIEWSEDEKTLKTFWENTKKLKSIYKIKDNKLIDFTVFNLSGKPIILRESTGVEVDLVNFKIKQKRIKFRVQEEFIKNCFNILKNGNKQ